MLRFGWSIAPVSPVAGIVVTAILVAAILVAMPAAASAAEPPAGDPELARDILPLFKNRCVKCHGPAKQEGGLNLSSAPSVARGGENGAVVVQNDLDSSLLWKRVDSDEMPPDDPLPAEEKSLVERWIKSGAQGLPQSTASDPKGNAATVQHWAFGPLRQPLAPTVQDSARADSPIDRFVLAALEARGLALNPEADRATLIRRVSIDLTGLPPSPEEIAEFLGDQSRGAYARMVERYLASPHYGERWGKYWLDAAGYADSNGYFNADTDRPLAYRYRDYVVRSLNEDKPFDRFVLEQIAGDELSGFVPGADATPEMISLLVATHYLRNGQDGTGETDGNADETRIDRYAALEATTQIVASSLLGLTFQCAKCHDHKFEPVSQRDYYQLQSVFYPALNIQDWLKPNDRHLYANLPGELARWEQRSQEIDGQIAALRAEFVAWARANRPPSTVLFHDEFEDSGPPLTDNWSNVAPGDDAPGGAPAVQLDSSEAPGAARQNGALAILESGAAGDRWLSTRQGFDWTPDGAEQWIQVSFDLVADTVVPGGTPAARIAYLLALHDFDDNSPVRQGNVLVDGDPAGGAAVHLDYPGADAKSAGTLGNGKYQPGHNYAVRITNAGDGKFRLEHLIDSVPDEKTLTLEAEDLPDGGFGFEYCCGRSFKADNVVVERSTANPSNGNPSDGNPSDANPSDGQQPADTLRSKQKELAAAIKAKQRERGDKPGKISCVFERSASPPDVFLLERGNYGAPQEKVTPAPVSAVAEPDDALEIRPPLAEAKSSGRRLAWARWLTRENSRQAALVARVQANRLWQQHFGAGIVATTENLGVSGAPPTHPELLEYLAGRLVDSRWSMKALHREILASATYRQTSTHNEKAFELDPENRLYWRYALKRLDAEALRDAILAISGGLDPQFGGAYVPTTRNEQGEVVVDPSAVGAQRRTLYLQQRRTQTLSFLNVFDSPSIVFNCVQRPTSTIPLQSLSLLNSDFVVAQAGRFAERLQREAPGSEAPDSAEARVARAFLLTIARPPSAAELASSLEFIATQREKYAAAADAEQKTWSDFCQMMLASNLFLYVE